MNMSLSHPAPCGQVTVRRAPRYVRALLRLPNGVLTSGPTSSSKSFVKVHQEVLQDSEWYGPEEPDHVVAPAASAAAPAAAANRSDVRLMASFTKFLKSRKLDLSAIFCQEPVLSADSRVVCDMAGHHGELLSEYLTSGGMRVGEELPHWFVNGNIRGAIKCWMATRPAASSLTEARGAAGSMDAQQAQEQGHVDRAASVAQHQPLGRAASGLVDPLLSAMPVWRAGHAQELSGWEPATGIQATAEDVTMLHCFGAIVYSSRLDVTTFLHQLCGADPFSWAMAQVAQGLVSEPDPWLLERFFMSTHVVGQELPLWFATWGVREEVRKWLQGPQAEALVRSLLDARGTAGAAGSPATAAAAAAASHPADGQVVDAATALSRLEACAEQMLALSLAPHNAAPTASAVASPSVHIRRGALLADATDPSGTSYAADLVVQRDGAAALVAVTASDDVAAVRVAKERLDWLGFLVQQESGLEPEAVAKVMLLVADEAAGPGAAPQPLLPSVAEYLEQGGVKCVGATELPRQEDE